MGGIEPFHTDHLSWDDKVLYEPFQPEPIFKVQRLIHFSKFLPLSDRNLSEKP